MFALDCDIYRGTQACLWRGLLRTFLPRHILWSLTVIYQETYAWLSSDFNSEFFLHHIIRKRENKLCQSPACRHHVLLSNFHDMRCNTRNIKKKKTCKFSEWFDEIVSHRSRNLNMYKRPFVYLLKKWSSTLYPSGKEKWCLKCPTIMVKANFTIWFFNITSKSTPSECLYSWLSKLSLP